MEDRTKYIIMVGDGMADRPGDFPGEKTPLAAAETPNLDLAASRGEAGLVATVPAGMDPGSDVANMSLLGCDPHKFYSGRAPLEAASMGIELGPDQVAYRCNLVHIVSTGGETLSPSSIMATHSSGHITTPEAREIILDLDRTIGAPGMKFYPGVSYRHLLVLDGAPLGTRLTPPHDITGRPIGDYFPKGEGADRLRGIMDEAAPILASHPVNIRREREGKPTANSVWFWGQGGRPKMPTLKDQYGITGAVVSAVDLIKGLGKLLGMEVIDVPGATGYLDTNYEGKVSAAIEALDRVDLVFIHVEAPDEAGHQGDREAKIRAIEDFDRKVAGPILEGVKRFPRWAVMAVTDHPTPLSIMTHSGEPVPWAVLRSGETSGDRGLSFDESSFAGLDVIDGGESLMRLFLGGPGHGRGG